MCVGKSWQLSDSPMIISLQHNKMQIGGGGGIGDSGGVIAFVQRWWQWWCCWKWGLVVRVLIVMVSGGVEGTRGGEGGCRSID